MSDPTNSEVFDLNSLVPQKTVVKFGDPARDVEIAPPTTQQIFELGALGKKLQGMGEASEEQSIAIVEEATALVYKIVPGLNEEPLNFKQLFKLIEIISQMAIPEKNKELKARGIDADTPKTNP